MKKRFLGAVLAVALVVSCFTLFAFNVHATTNMKASDACINTIKELEGFFAIPYWDYSQWTVGFGTTCPADRLEEYKVTGIPVEDAEELLREQLAKFEKAVNEYAKKHNLKLTQNQFDALVSFTYNLGSSTLTKSSSTLSKAILSGASDNELIYAFSIYCMAGGEYMPGLMRRRLVEANMFIHGVYDDYAPDTYCYVRYDANGGVRDTSAQGYDANMPVAPMSRPTKSGYQFVGWYTAPEGGMKITSLDETTNGMTLYAHWQKSETEAENPVDPIGGINVIVVSAAVHVRCGPSTGYGIVSSVHAGDKLTILGTTLSNGVLWGQFDEGWIDLIHTNYNEIVAPDTDEDEQKPVWNVPVMATVMKDGILVYNGPHTTYPQLKTLKLDTQILVLEIMEFAGKEWARYEGGWVQMGMNLLIHDENKLVHNFNVTTQNTVNVRSGPGVSYSKETTLSKGTSHKVYSIVMVDGAAWGRVAKGWIELSNTNYDASKLEQYRNHSFGSWYVSKAGTCVNPGQERRDCAYCDHYETRDAAKGDHVYGSWYVVKEADCTNSGLEQRDCQYCNSKETKNIPAHGHDFGAWYETKAPTATTAGEERRDCKACDYYETREVEATTHSFGQWYVTEEATCTEPGQERRDCQECDYYETREVEPTGHTMGVWYESVAPTVSDYGQERRDCQHCDYYETRPLDKLPAPTTKRTYATVTCTTLRIRSGPGTGYTAVGKLSYGAVVEVFEIVTVGDSDWGRIEQGWICLTGNTTLEEVDEPITHTHSFGQWYTEKAATCTKDGILRRDCDCGDYETKTVAATGHSFGDWYVSKAATAEKAGQERRDCANCDHNETREIPKLNVVVKIYATVTCSRLYIREGAGTGYARLGSYVKGDVVEILEQATVDGKIWGRTNKGWICLTGNTTLKEVEEVITHTHRFGAWYVSKEATTTEYGQERRDCACGHYETRQTPKKEAVTKVYATITCSSLSIRAGAGTGYTRLGYYYKGETVEILEQVTVDGRIWGRTNKGWICLTGNATLKTVTEK